MALNPTVDSLLDKTVVLSFTNVGYRLRSSGWPEYPSMTGKTVVVTGATSGLGLDAAGTFAALGARTVLVGRDEEKASRAAADVRAATGNEGVEVALCDLAELGSVRRLAADLAERLGSIDVLIHNAGALVGERRETGDGMEFTFASQVVGPFLLTKLLLPQLRGAAPSRVVVVSSGGMYARRIKVRDLQFAEGEFNGTIAYARAKRAQVILTRMVSPALAEAGVYLNAMHPGWADTPGVKASLPTFRTITRPFLRNAAQGADTIVWLASADEAADLHGGFYLDRVDRPVHRFDRTKETEEERAELWRQVTGLSGEELPLPADSCTIGE